MAIKKELVQFTIVNDTDCAFNIPLMQQNVYSINAKTKYSWDITTANLSCGTGTIVINGVTTTITFTPDLTGLLAALNGLGFGFFCTETIGGQTFLYVTDDKNIYGGLDLCPSGTTTTTTTSTTTAAPVGTTTTTTTSTTTIAPTTTTTTSTTTAAPPTISLGSPSCRNNNCNDNAFCTVVYNINTTDAPAGSYITVTTDPPPSGASVTILNSDPNLGTLLYSEPDGLQPAVFFTLELRDSGGNIIATSSTSLAHQSFWQFLPLCSSLTTTTTTTSTTTAAPTTTTTTTSTTTAAPTTTTTTSTTTAAPTTTTTTTTTSTTTAAPLAVSSMLYSIQQINITDCQVQADITLNGNVSQNTDFDFQYQLNSTGSTLYFGTVTVLAGQNIGTALVGSASSALCSDGVNSGCINTVTGDTVSITGFSC